MDKRIAQLYIGYSNYNFYKCYKVNNPNDVNTSILDTINKCDMYMINGLYIEYPYLLNMNKNEIYETLQKDNDLYLLLDDMFCKIFS